MKKERIDYFIEYIFDYFRKTNCSRIGQGFMLRNIKFTSEKTLTKPQIINLWFFIDLLIHNNYLGLKERDFIYLTEKGSDYINGIDTLIPLVDFEQLMNSDGPINKDLIFNNLWNLIGEDEDNTLFYTKGSVYYDTIKHYLTSLLLPTTYSEYIEYLRNTNKKTSRGIWYRDLFKSLSDSDVKSFLRDLSINVNRIIKIMYEPNDDIEDFDIIQNSRYISEDVILKPQTTQVEAPLVLISYAWEEDDDEYMNWVVKISSDLRNNGINAQIDKYQPYGKDLVKFMLENIRNSKKVLCILTPKYKIKAESGCGGAAYEGSIISHEIYKNQDTLKFIPILRKGSFEKSTPDFLEGRKGFDCSTEEKYNRELSFIIKAIKEEELIDIPPVKVV